MIKVGFKKLTECAILPVKAHPRDSGFDLFVNEDIVIEPGETAVIKTGIAVSLPDCYEAQVRPRSGVTSKTKLRVQIGTIDNDYTGEIGIIVDNIAHNSHIGSFYIDERTHDPHANDDCYFIRKGDKLAQLVIQTIPMVEAYEIDELPTTVRGNKGYGSSGY